MGGTGVPRKLRKTKMGEGHRRTLTMINSSSLESVKVIIEGILIVEIN